MRFCNSRGQELAMETAAATIPDIEGQNNVSRTLRGGTDTTPSRSRTFDTLSRTDSAVPYYKVLNCLEEMQLFVPNMVPIIKKKGGGTMQSSPTVLEVPPKGSALHANILTSITTLGRQRNVQHFVEYNIKDKSIGGRTRSDKICDLSKINTTAVGIKEECDSEITLKTSTTEGELDKTEYIRDMLLKEIKDMQDYEESREDEDDKVTIPDVKSGVKKLKVVQHLVKWRNKVYTKHPTLKDEIIKDIRAKYANKGMSTKESRVELLEDVFFKLSDTIRSKERYTNANANA